MVRRSRSVIVAALPLALLGACDREAAQPPIALEEPVAPAAVTAPGVGYACESGETVTVRYPDADTAEATYRNETFALRAAPAASGARYVGAGVEWWSVVRDGQETATLARIGPNEQVAGSVLERCIRPASNAGTGLASGTAPAAAAGGVLPAAVPCKGSELRLEAVATDAGAGNRLTTLAVTNLGPRACSLTGWPAVALLDAQGREAATVRVDQTPGPSLGVGQAPAPVELPARVKAYFDIGWNVVPHEGQGERACPAVARVRATAPGDATALSVVQAMTPCGGRVRISPFRAAAEPEPAVTGG